MKIGISFLKDATLLGPFDYSQDMPIPRIGETVHMESFFPESILSGVTTFMQVSNVLYFRDEIIIQIVNQDDSIIDFERRFIENYTNKDNQ